MKSGGALVYRAFLSHNVTFGYTQEKIEQSLLLPHGLIVRNLILQLWYMDLEWWRVLWENRPTTLTELYTFIVLKNSSVFCFRVWIGSGFVESLETSNVEDRRSVSTET